mmetsp:Transcript_16668/g.32612  ORF Transcript_16668/g.32612 Transcript_16668/m.32612 type:complete len:202 (+) Transcript_16668:610-1215(+)
MAMGWHSRPPAISTVFCFSSSARLRAWSKANDWRDLPKTCCCMSKASWCFLMVISRSNSSISRASCSSFQAACLASSRAQPAAKAKELAVPVALSGWPWLEPAPAPSPVQAVAQASSSHGNGIRRMSNGLNDFGRTQKSSPPVKTTFHRWSSARYAVSRPRFPFASKFFTKPSSRTLSPTCKMTSPAACAAASADAISALP